MCKKVRCRLFSKPLCMHAEALSMSFEHSYVLLETATLPSGGRDDFNRQLTKVQLYI